MEKLKHFLLPENTNTLYEKEAISSISLTKNVAVKINEIVDSINALAEADLKWKQTVEGKVNKGVVFMKDNLVNSLQSLFDMYLTAGFIDERIEAYASDLIQRLDNLLGSITEGSTSMDAEIIDARLDAEGISWGTLGESVRTITSLLSSKLRDVLEAEMISITGSTGVGYYDEQGAFNDNSSYSFIKAPVEANKVYYVKGQYGYVVPLVVAVDGNGAVIKTYFTSDSSMITEEFQKEIIAPVGASHLIVNGRTTFLPEIRELVKWNVNPDRFTEYLETIAENYRGDVIKYSDDIAEPYIEEGYVITEDKITSVDFSANLQPVIYRIPVKGGERYKIHCSYAYKNQPYIILNTHGNVIESGVSGNGLSSPITYDVEMTIPYGGTTLVIASQLTTTEGFCYKQEGFSSVPINMHHVKWCCFGDSLTEENNTTTKRYFDYVADKTEIKIQNCGVGGTGYARGQDTNTAFYQRVNTIESDCDVITLFGSFNDLGSGLAIGTPSDTGTGTIAGCINTTLDAIFEKFPLVPLGVVAPCPWASTKPSTSGTAFEYVELLKAICEERSIPFLDLWRGSNLRPWNNIFRLLAYKNDATNGVHPSEEGHRILSAKFYTFINSLCSTF